MDFYIREELAVATPNIVELFAQEAAPSSKRTNKRFVVEIAAVHEGISKNYNKYTADALTEAVDSWLSPYPKPILINHNLEAEPLGRIVKSSIARSTEGVSYIQLRAALSDPTAIAKVLDGRYMTGSVGALPTAAICSICHSDVVAASKEGSFCGHERGRTYDGQTCVYEHKGIRFHEYSFVNVPGDSHSLVQGHYSESYSGLLDVYSVDLEQHSIHRLTESDGAVNILENMDTHSANMLFSDLAYGTKFAESDALHSEQITNNISFIENTRTIANESDSSDTQELGNMTSQISENTETGVEDEDILSVADRLSDELNETVEESTDETPVEETVVEEQTEVNEEVEESTDVSEDATGQDAIESEVVVDESTEETEVQDSTDVAEVEESTAEATETTEDEVITEEAPEVEETEAETAEVIEESEGVDVAALQTRIETLEAENESLKAQNTKMKDALHNELAEKVVDARIAVGLLEYDERAEALESHKARSAASLADALVDIRKYAEKNNFEVNIIKGTVPSLDIKARVTSTESDSVETVVSEDEDIQEEVVIDEKDLFVDKFSSLLFKGEQKFLSTLK